MTSNDIRTVTLRMNDENVAKKIENLNKRLDNARRIKEKLEKKAVTKDLTKNEANDLRKFTQEVERCERQLGKMRATKQEVDRVLSNLSTAGVKELKRTLEALNHEIDSGSVKRGSEDWKKYQKAIRDVKTELQKVQKEQEAVTAKGVRFKDWLNTGANLYMTIQGTIYALTGLKSTVQQSVQAFAEMEEAEADVMKYTGKTKKEVDDLNESLKEMDTRTGREQLNALAGDAGRLGLKSKQEILEFVDAADKINIALGEDLGEDAVKNIGKLAMLFGENKRLGLRQAMLSTGSAINELAQNSSAAETYILDFTARLAGVSKQANIAQANIMGYAAVLDESMLRDEMASTAMQQLIVKIFQDPARMAKAAGLEIQRFSELVRTDANAALLQFFDAMNARGGFDSLAPMFEEMHLNGQRAVGVLSAVAGQIDTVRERQELANNAYREANSVQKEFDVKNNTVQAQLDKAKKRFHELAVSLGERLLPIMRDGIHLTSKIMSLTISVIDWSKKYGKNLLWLAGAIAAWTLAVKAHTIAEQVSFAFFKIQYAFRVGALSSWAALTAAIKNNVIVSTLWNAVVKAGNVAMALWAVVTELVTGKTIALTVAQRTLTIAMRKNPIGFFVELLLKLVAVLLTVIGLYKWFDSILGETNKELTQQQKLIADSINLHQRAAEAASGEISRIRTLTAVIHDNSRSYGDRMRAIQTLQKIVPGYTATIDRETGALRENAQAVADYITMLKKKAVADAANSANAKLGEELLYHGERLGRMKTAVLKRRDRLSALKMEYSEISEEIQLVADGRKTINEVLSSKEWIQKGIRLREKGSTKNYLDALHRAREFGAQLRQAEGWVRDAEQAVSGIEERMDSNIRTAQEYGADMVAAIEEAVDSVIPEKVPTAPISGSGGSGGTGNTTDPRKEAAEKLAREAEIERTRQKMYYEAGISERREYEEQLLMIDEQLYTAQRDLYTNADQEWWQFESKRIDALQKWNKQIDDWSLEDIQRQQQEELDAEMQAWAKELYAEEEHQRRMAEIKRKYSLREADFLETIGQGNEAERRRREVQEQDTKDMLQKRTKLMQQLAEMQKKYETETTEQTMETELQAAESLCQQLGIEEEKKQKLLKAIRDKYVADDKAKQEENERKTREYYESILPGGAEGATQKLLSLANVLSKIHEHLGKEGQWGWQEYAAVAVAAIDTVCATLSAASSYMQAAYDADAAKVEARYDREIKAAGSGTKRAKQLEEQKEKELAQIKNKYNKQAMAVELAQAVAGTAMAAINAYASAAKIPVIGWKLAPIAAAMATAAGLLQIATIKKQHEAQTAGYYEGGFTGGAQYRREAGIVHEGEFVANHQAVQNPSIMPVLRLIDQAQRQNRVANVSTADIVRSTGAAPSTAAQPTTVVVDTSSRRTAEAIEKLNRKLESPIETYVTIDGPQGLHKQYEHYKKLIAQG